MPPPQDSCSSSTTGVLGNGRAPVSETQDSRDQAWKQAVSTELRKKLKTWQDEGADGTAKVQVIGSDTGAPVAKHRSKPKFVPCNKNDFHFVRIIGAGSFGRVSLARHKDSNQTVAIKILSKAAIVREQQVQHVIDERGMLQHVSGHPFLINLRGSFQDTDCIYLVMDFVQGGEFFTHLRDHGRLREEHARFYAAQIVLALEYLHARGIAYRDLKPENLLISADGYVRLTDFGFAKVVGKRTFTMCGTPDYLAPEVILGQGHTPVVDWWSLGCVIQEMLSGFPPFYTGDAQKTYQRIAQLKYDFPPYFSPYARDLIKRFLVPSPEQRLGGGAEGVQAIKDHVWFKNLDWALVSEKAYMAPYMPEVKAPDDTSRFDKYENLAPLLPATELSAAQQAFFNCF